MQTLAEPTLRVPPHSDEAEQSVLGGLLLDNRAWDKAGDLLTEADFYRHEHRLIFGAIGALLAANKPADVLTVFDRLQGLDVGMDYLQALSVSVPSASNIRRYAEIVRERSILRKLISAGDDIATSAFNPQGKSAGEIIDAAASIIGELDRRQQRKAPQAVGDLIAAALDRYTNLAEGKKSPANRTGIPPLDRMLNGGLRPGKVYGIAARPSVGKSSAARTILVNQALDGIPTLLLSQEMPIDEVIDCMVSELGRIDSAALQTGQFAREDWGRLSEGAERLIGLPLYVDDQGSLTLADIRSKARTVKGLGLLAVDYLQLCSTTLKGKTTNDEVAELSKGLKALAMELGIPIIVLSQLNRDVEKRADKEPMLADLRDSGAIEQDLDVAVLLWTAQDGNDSRLVGWKVAKHRGGPKGIFGMRWQPSVNRWDESMETLKPAAKAQKGSL